MSDLEWLAAVERTRASEIGKVYLDCDRITLHEAELNATYGVSSTRFLGREIARGVIRDGQAERLGITGSGCYQVAAWHGDQLMWVWEATYFAGGPAAFLTLPPFPLEVTVSG